MKYFLGLIALIVILGAGWYFFSSPQTEAPAADMNVNVDPSGGNNEEMTGDTDTGTDSTNGGTDVGMDSTGEAMIDAPDATLDISAKNFTFSQKEIRVKRGDTVRLNLTSAEGFHDFVIDEITGAKTSRVNTGESTSITFMADKTGTFEYYCSVGTHREMGMVGNLIVE